MVTKQAQIRALNATAELIIHTFNLIPVNLLTNFYLLYRYEKDLADKIWLQQDAMRSLNAQAPLMHVEALICDETPPPPNRPFPLWDTPPIKDFNWKEYTRQKEEQEDDEGESEGEDKPLT